MKRIGITGGIGSGKSTIARILEALGYRVYYADTRARALMERDPGIRSGLLALFGEQAYLSSGELNRAHIGSIVFRDREKLEALNVLVHPVTRADFERWAETTPVEYDKQLVFKEAAILFESGAWQEADAVITVYAPKSLRLARVCKRDGVAPEAVLQRMDKQWSDLRKLLLADVVIYNDGKHHLLPQIREILHDLRK